jgi:hypothetical protein
MSVRLHFSCPKSFVKHHLLALPWSLSESQQAQFSDDAGFSSIVFPWLYKLPTHNTQCTEEEFVGATMLGIWDANFSSGFSCG